MGSKTPDLHTIVVHFAQELSSFVGIAKRIFAADDIHLEQVLEYIPKEVFLDVRASVPFEVDRGYTSPQPTRR